MVLTENSSLATVRQRVWASAQRTISGPLQTLTFRAMSTHCQVKVHSANAALVKKYLDQALDWISWFEARYSRFIEDSLVSQINRAAGRDWVEIDPETEGLLSLCQDMIFFTSGVFDPTALPLIKLWNWKSQPETVPTEEMVQAARKLTGWQGLQRRKGAVKLAREGMMIDFGGIGKEFAVDRVLQMGLDLGLGDVLVDFGQDIRTHGHPPHNPMWTVGLEDPRQPGACWASVSLTDGSVATSGDYVRHFTLQGQRFGHIIDPRSGYPVDNGTMAVSVIAPYCTFAGILSTASFVLGARDGLKMMALCPGVEGAIVTKDNCYLTKGFTNYASKNS
jgi:thiamine biosynthesis lipoprotein